MCKTDGQKLPQHGLDCLPAPQVLSINGLIKSKDIKTFLAKLSSLKLRVYYLTGFDPSWISLFHLGIFLVQVYARVDLYQFSTIT